ncbi:MAG: helix-turn-helix domain-containing protein [Mycobacteriaceae bacterium]
MRSLQSGLKRDAPIIQAPYATSKVATRLLACAKPILEEVEKDINGMDLAIVLADSRSKLVDIRVGHKTFQNNMERIGVIPGRIFDEPHVGTNSIGTTLEAGTNVTVRGGEHYIEDLQPFHCYGGLIVNPLTRRVEGVLDITCLDSSDSHSDALKLFLSTTVKKVEHRIFMQGKAAQIDVFQVFHQAILRFKTAPVIATNGEIFMANNQAASLLGPTDYSNIMKLTHAPDLAGYHTQITLASGYEVEVVIEPLTQGVLVVLGKMKIARNLPVKPMKMKNLTIAICGEPGSGLTYQANLMLNNEEAHWLDTSDATLLGEQKWLTQLRTHLAVGPVVIEALHLASQVLVRQIRKILENSNHTAIFTSLPFDQLEGEHAELIATCMEKIMLKALKERAHEIPNLVSKMLTSMSSTNIKFTPQAMKILVDHSWQGNIRELHSLVQYICAQRSSGDITPSDLPNSYQIQRKAMTLSPIERSERDAIELMLITTRGNKSEAAYQLGISRTTLYRAIQRYGIVLAPKP